MLRPLRFSSRIYSFSVWIGNIQYAKKKQQHSASKPVKKMTNPKKPAEEDDFLNDFASEEEVNEYAAKFTPKRNKIVDTTLLQNELQELISSTHEFTTEEVTIHYQFLMDILQNYSNKSITPLKDLLEKVVLKLLETMIVLGMPDEFMNLLSEYDQRLNSTLKMNLLYVDCNLKMGAISDAMSELQNTFHFGQSITMEIWSEYMQKFNRAIQLWNSGAFKELEAKGQTNENSIEKMNENMEKISQILDKIEVLSWEVIYYWMSCWVHLKKPLKVLSLFKSIYEKRREFYKVEALEGRAMVCKGFIDACLTLNSSPEMLQTIWSELTKAQMKGFDFSIATVCEFIERRIALNTVLTESEANNCKLLLQKLSVNTRNHSESQDFSIENRIENSLSNAKKKSIYLNCAKMMKEESERIVFQMDVISQLELIQFTQGHLLSVYEQKKYTLRSQIFKALLANELFSETTQFLDICFQIESLQQTSFVEAMLEAYYSAICFKSISNNQIIQDHIIALCEKKHIPLSSNSCSFILRGYLLNRSFEALINFAQTYVINNEQMKQELQTADFNHIFIAYSKTNDVAAMMRLVTEMIAHSKEPNQNTVSIVTVALIQSGNIEGCDSFLEIMRSQFGLVPNEQTLKLMESTATANLAPKQE